MTFQELLNELPNGFPQVKDANGRIGRVTSVKHSRCGYKGITVNFGQSYNSWFHAEDGTDGRSRYMSELTINKQ